MRATKMAALLIRMIEDRRRVRRVTFIDRCEKPGIPPAFINLLLDGPSLPYVHNTWGERRKWNEIKTGSPTRWARKWR